MNIVCNVCKQTFLSTSRAPQYAPLVLAAQRIAQADITTPRLTQHAENKHNSTLPQCFPEFKVEA